MCRLVCPYEWIDRLLSKYPIRNLRMSAEVLFHAVLSGSAQRVIFVLRYLHTGTFGDTDGVRLGGVQRADDEYQGGEFKGLALMPVGPE